VEPRWRPEYFPCYPNLVDRYDISISQITMIFFTFYVDVSLAVLLIYTVNTGKSLGSDRGKKHQRKK
jgi:hypothetical protein